MGVSAQHNKLSIIQHLSAVTQYHQLTRRRWNRSAPHGKSANAKAQPKSQTKSQVQPQPQEGAESRSTPEIPFIEHM